MGGSHSHQAETHARSDDNLFAPDHVEVPEKVPREYGKEEVGHDTRDCRDMLALDHEKAAEREDHSLPKVIETGVALR